MDMIRIIDNSDEVRYINKEYIIEIFEALGWIWDDENETKKEAIKETVIILDNGVVVRTRESLEDLRKRLILR